MTVGCYASKVDIKAVVTIRATPSARSRMVPGVSNQCATASGRPRRSSSRAAGARAAGGPPRRAGARGTPAAAADARPPSGTPRSTGGTSTPAGPSRPGTTRSARRWSRKRTRTRGAGTPRSTSASRRRAGTRPPCRRRRDRARRRCRRRRAARGSRGSPVGRGCPRTADRAPARAEVEPMDPPELLRSRTSLLPLAAVSIPPARQPRAFHQPQTPDPVSGSDSTCAIIRSPRQSTIAREQPSASRPRSRLNAVLVCPTGC